MTPNEAVLGDFLRDLDIESAGDIIGAVVSWAEEYPWAGRRLARRLKESRVVTPWSYSGHRAPVEVHQWTCYTLAGDPAAYIEATPTEVYWYCRVAGDPENPGRAEYDPRMQFMVFRHSVSSAEDGHEQICALLERHGWVFKHEGLPRPPEEP